MNDEPNYDELDPGIRHAVHLLRAWGFSTTDSGDGKTKPAHPDVLPYPHVAILAERDHLCHEADSVALCLRQYGWGVAEGFPPGKPTVQATYDPADETAIIMVTWPPAAAPARDPWLGKAPRQMPPALTPALDADDKGRPWVLAMRSKPEGSTSMEGDDGLAAKWRRAMEVVDRYDREKRYRLSLERIRDDWGEVWGATRDFRVEGGNIERMYVCSCCGEESAVRHEDIAHDGDCAVAIARAALEGPT